MLRASSLGLYFPQLAIRGPRPCHFIYRVGIVSGTCMGSPTQVARPLSSAIRLPGKGERLSRDERSRIRSLNARYVGNPSRSYQARGLNVHATPSRVVSHLPPHMSPLLTELRSPSTGQKLTQKIRLCFALNLRQALNVRPRKGLRSEYLYRLNRGRGLMLVMRKIVRRSTTRKKLKPPKPPIPQYIVDPASYPTGRPWRPLLIKPISVRKRNLNAPSHFGLSRGLESLRYSLLRTIAVTQLASEAWDAYSNLLLIDISVVPPPGKLLIPLVHMHRLFRILARDRPKTRTLFLRMLSVLTAIRNAGGTIHVHEWNALIDASGKGWRKARVEDFETALSLFKDMVSGDAPGTALAQGNGKSVLPRGEPVEPNTITYTTLINLAARTSHGPTFDRATSLLDVSGLPPNRITHLSVLKYFTSTKQLSGVRSTLFKMRQQGFELGIDGINGLLLAYAANERIDVTMMIYRLLRHSLSPELYVGENDVESVARQLREEEYITIDPRIQPNEITFTIMIQIMAYHGNLLATLTVFMDMISSDNLEMGAPLICNEDGLLKPTTYSPTLPVFRAIFLGFSRHGICLTGKNVAFNRPQRVNSSGQPTWSLENLQSLFDTFLALPRNIVITKSTIYWILIAFQKTSGNDITLLRQIWKQLEVRFNGPWGAPTNRLNKFRSTLFPEEHDMPGGGKH